MFKRVLAFLVITALIYCGAWVIAAFWFKARLETWARDLGTQGYTVATSEPLLVGFPARVGVSVQSLSVTAPTVQGGWHWEAGPIRVSLLATAPTTPVVTLAGTHRIAGLFSSSDQGLTIAIGDGHAAFAFQRDGTIRSIDLALQDLAAAETPGATAVFSAKDLELQFAPADSTHVAFRAHGLVFPQAPSALRRPLDTLNISVDLQGRLPGGPLPQSLEAWRTAGGTFEVRSFALDWPPLTAAGTGTFALDEALQPIGAFTIKFQGFFETLTMLTTAGLVEEQHTSMARIVLGLLAKPTGNGGPPEISLPLTVQARKLYAGPVMLAEFPSLIWDENAHVP